MATDNISRAHPTARWLTLAAVLLLTSAAIAWPRTGPLTDPELADRRPTGWKWLGAVLGMVLACSQRHPFRIWGLIPLGLTGLALILTVAGLGRDSLAASGLELLLGLTAGLSLVAAGRACLQDQRVDARFGAAIALMLVGGVSAVVLSGFIWQKLARQGELAFTLASWLLVLLTFGAAAAAWYACLRAALEQLLEVLLWPCYRIRAHGPGLTTLPRHGPVLILANHSAYFDPIWLGKVVPRPLTPMMTSVFYDKPWLRWLMVHVVGAIRVQAATYRREAPELQEAVAALDAGKCLVIFPEAYLRRTEAQPLRQFGQGIWRVLKERPQTPVVACWIEGGWGSYFSYWNGPPLCNKRLDWWRRIDIALEEPRTLDAALLEDQRATRAYLMQAVLDCRKYLGLSPLTPEPSSN